MKRSWRARREYLLMVSAVVVGVPIARVLDITTRMWLRQRRRAQRERAVVAELISRGIDVASVDLQQMSANVPPRVTPTVVKRMADQLEGFMRFVQARQQRPDA